MKNRTFITAVLATMLTLNACNGTVSADETKYSYQLEPEMVQKLDETVKLMRQTQLNEPGYTASLNSDDHTDFSGYDAAKGYAIYYTAFSIMRDYADTESYDGLPSSDTPTYVIPYANTNCEGLIYLSSDEQGVLDFSMRSIGTGSEFPLEEIEAAAAQLGDVSEIRLLKEYMCDLNMVYITTDGEEYIIPYAYSEPMREAFYDITSGEVYTASDFMNWVAKGFDWDNMPTDAYGSGLPYYIGCEITPVEIEPAFSMPGVLIPAGTSVLTLAAAGGLTMYGVKTLRKRKNNQDNAPLQ